MTIAVRPAVTARVQRDFFRLPFRLYRGDPFWVPPVTSEVRRVLDSARNPYFAEASLRLLVGYADGAPAARLAVVINKRHERQFGVRAAFFGFFESIDDERVAGALFEETEKEARADGAEVLEGPFNPHPYSEVGLQVDGFGASPRFFQPYNPPFYPRLVEAAGFRTEAVFQTMTNDAIGPGPNERGGVARAAGRAGGYVVRGLSLRDLEGDLERIREVNNEAFAGQWHFLPLSREEYAFSARHLKLVTRPDLVKIVEHRGRPVAVLHCVLDINPLLKRLGGRVGPIKYLRFLAGRGKIRRLIVFTVAVKAAYRHTRVFALLMEEFRRMSARFEAAETTWVSPDNPSAWRAAESLGMVPGKHFAVYAKRIRP